MGEEVDFVVCVVLPASGQGVRMNISTPKQYCAVLEAPLLLYSVEAFHRLPWVKRVIVTVDGSRLEYVRRLMVEKGLVRVSVVEGGKTRHRSIRAGINALTTVCPPPDVVLIHDVVRPLVEPDVVRAVSVAARNHGVVRPLVSTVISTDDDDFLVQSLDRSKFRASEMPQGFQYDVIRTAYQKCTADELDHGTECLQLALAHAGTKAKLIHGPSSLWKVTNKKDLYAAEGILKERHLCAGVVGCPAGLVSCLTCSFDLKFLRVTLVKSHTELPEGTTDLIVFQPFSEMEMTVSALPEGDDERRAKRLCDLLGSLVWDRSKALSGQVIIVT